MAQNLAFGLVTGGFLLLATLGFALVSRVEKFLNIAHAELITVGALGTWWFSTNGVPFLLAAVLAVGLTSLIGLATARFIYDPINHKGPSILLITSVGVVFIMHGIAEALVGSGIRSFPLPLVPSWDLGAFLMNPYHFVVIVVALASVGVLHLFLTRTRIGVVIRALADNRELANVRGIDVRRATGAVWLVSSALAGVAGVALGVIGTITPELGFQQILLILTVSIVAGLGSIYGVAVAAFVIGMAMDLSVLWIPPGYRTAVAFAAVILVLTLRPQGLLGEAKT